MRNMGTEGDDDVIGFTLRGSNAGHNSARS